MAWHAVHNCPKSRSLTQWHTYLHTQTDWLLKPHLHICMHTRRCYAPLKMAGVCSVHSILIWQPRNTASRMFSCRSWAPLMGDCDYIITELTWVTTNGITQACFSGRAKLLLWGTPPFNRTSPIFYIGINCTSNVCNFTRQNYNLWI